VSPSDPCPSDAADPDRPWAWRDSGHGAEDADDIDDDGAIDTEDSYALAQARFPCLVTPIDRRER
jgi:hypothetical protein